MKIHVRKKGKTVKRTFFRAMPFSNYTVSQNAVFKLCLVEKLFTIMPTYGFISIAGLSVIMFALFPTVSATLECSQMLRNEIGNTLCSLWLKVTDLNALFYAIVKFCTTRRRFAF